MTTLALINGDLTLAKISGADALKQRIKNRLALYLGEWYLEPSAGIDWFSASKSSSEFIKNLILKELRKEEHITKINSVEVSQFENLSDRTSGRSRFAGVNYSVNTVFGVLNGNV